MAASAYVNLFELQLTQNQPFDSELETHYIQRFSKDKKSFIHYQMPKILEDIVEGPSVDIEEWRQKYREVGARWLEF